MLTLQWCLDRQCQVNVWLEGANISPLWFAVTMVSIWGTNGSIPAHLPDPGYCDNKPCRRTVHMLWLMRADTLSKHATENSPSVFTHSHTLKIESEPQRWVSALLREITCYKIDESVYVSSPPSPSVRFDFALQISMEQFSPTLLTVMFYSDGSFQTTKNIWTKMNCFNSFGESKLLTGTWRLISASLMVLNQCPFHAHNVDKL